jgi:hypothetical protein
LAENEIACGRHAAIVAAGFAVNGGIYRHEFVGRVQGG